MIDKKVCFKIEKYRSNQKGKVMDKITIEGSDFYLINNFENNCIDTVRCDQVLYIDTSRW